MLVVIGILIALLINNWNENQIRQNAIDESLAQILSDLQQDKTELEFIFNEESVHIIYLRNITNTNNSDKELKQILENLDHYMDFSGNDNGYSGLKSSGKISNINKTNIKLNLTNYFEIIYENIKAASHFAETFTNNHIVPFAIENLEPNSDLMTNKELVLEKLGNSNLKYLINYQIDTKIHSNKQVKTGLEHNTNLIQLIEKQLNLKK